MVTGAFPDGRTPVVLSAHGEGLIGQDAAAILAYLDGHRTVTEVADVASRLHRTRRLRRHRAVVRATDITELREGLGALAADDDHPLVTRATAPGRTADRGRTAFVFPGQGSQWPSMGVDAYARLPEYRAQVDECATVFVSMTSASPLEYLLADPAAELRTNDFTQVQIQGAQFVHGVALARVWQAAGVLPDLVVGHSLGELGAAYVAGTITLAAAVGVVIARATLLDRLTGPYRVAVLGIAPDQAQDVIAATPGWLELSVVNSKSSVAVSGDGTAVAAAVRAVSARGCFAKEIEMWFPAHTTALDSMRAELEALLPKGEFADTAVQFIGSATADVVKPGTRFADYWYANLRSTVRFDRAVGAAVAHGARTFVEMSAHPALLFAIDEVLDDLPDVAEGTTTVVGSGSRGEPIVERLSANIAAVALSDPGYRWSDALGDPRKPLPDFPFAPMRGDQLWALPQPLPPIAGITVALEHWARIPTVVPGRHRRVAVFDAGADTQLADSLRAAIDRHSGFVFAEPADADAFVVVAPQFEPGDAVRAAEQLSERIERDLFAYTSAITPGCRDVWLVTVGAERMQPFEPVARPAPAALAAMHRSVGLEYPDQRFGHLDLPIAEGVDAAIDAAVAVLLGDADVVTVRAGDSGAAAYRRSMRDAGPQSASWSADSGVLDDVVVTGGGGAIGMHYARTLAERGARRVVLLSRGGADAATLVRLTEAYGTEFAAPRCDLTDARQLASVAAEFAGDGASLVIHAAGVATIAPHRDLTSAAARDTFAAKVTGLHHLIQAWPLRRDARMLLCSSVSGLWGGRGHAVYSAANRLLDVMAERLRAEGRNCTAVRWGLWHDTGIIDADEVARVERSGLLGMRPERAAEVSLRDHAGDPMVFSADTDRLGAFLEPDRTAATVDDAPEAHDTVRDGGTTVRAALGAVLKLPDATGLDLDTSLLDLGVDSLLAVELRKRLKKATGRTVPLATILGGATATELIEHLESQGKKELNP
jgi:mycobactin polyketide synthetase MbtD